METDITSLLVGYHLYSREKGVFEKTQEIMTEFVRGLRDGNKIVYSLKNQLGSVFIRFDLGWGSLCRVQDCVKGVKVK